MSAGEPVHAQWEHAHRESGTAGQHGLPVVSLHRLHDGWRGWKPGGKAKAPVRHQVAKDSVWSAIWRHGYVPAAQAGWVCQGKVKNQVN